MNGRPIVVGVPFSTDLPGRADNTNNYWAFCGDLSWLPATTHSNVSPMLWRARFPAHIQAALVSLANPQGSITNSDLEMAGLIAQQDIIAQAVNCHGRTVVPLGDNIPAVVWHHKHSTTTTGPAAYLLRLNSIHQRHFRHMSKSNYIPGPVNQMADDCLRNTLAACAPEARDAFLSDLCLANQTARAGISAKRAADKDTMWLAWETFVDSLNITDPYLQHLSPNQQLSLLKVFAVRVRTGELASGGNPVSAERVQDYLRTAAEEISRLGSKLNPRKTLNHVMHMDLTNLKKAHAKEDPAPEKTKPVPITLVQHACARLHATGDIFSQCVANLLVIAFFWILRPGEYCYNCDYNHPFRLQDTTFLTPQGPVNGAVGNLHSMCFHLKTLLKFTTQKNAIRDEAISHGNTSDPWLCPGKATFHQVAHLRLNNALPDTPLHTVYTPQGVLRITAAHITAALRKSRQEIGHTLGIQPHEISACALRAGGATALFRAGVSPLNSSMPV